ncbi:protein of unknown function [Micromonospora rhizosphaerae]|uniref:Shedu protein SduA C-terminal domain-containing protein n=1 Tax=Micromonospora rhizosphaerae TaxID=568872 RepID=A0A1C6T449_9ACTN|nr:Shedu anti-phage system protein SduA domain-containing protein [Micromonospora rhizosphaerae]SCL36558.1 protein of unknown function [Micromonospora rhizosphaerae]
MTLEPVPLDTTSHPPGTRVRRWLDLAWKIPPFVITDDLGTSTPEGHLAPVDGIGRALLVDDESAVYKVIQGSKEVVFSIGEDGTYCFTPIGWVLDPQDNRQTLRPLVEVGYDSYEMAKWLSVMTALLDVPLIANSRAEVAVLDKLFDDAMTDGVEFTDSHGEKVRHRPTENIRSLAAGMRQVPQPAEVSNLFKQLEIARNANARAKAVIGRLDDAIDEMTDLLAASSRNENALQECLTRNPAFFGPSYSRVIPKHRLGAEYVTDYALELSDGSVDVVEIEASTHALYTNAGNPTSALVHAEQQVLDWLAWLDQNSPYARVNLPGVRRANGLVIIGTRSSLSQSDVERLRWRNMLFGGRIAVLTYDDLVVRCQALRNLLREEMNSDAV